MSTTGTWFNASPLGKVETLFTLLEKQTVLVIRVVNYQRCKLKLKELLELIAR